MRTTKNQNRHGSKYAQLLITSLVIGLLIVGCATMKQVKTEELDTDPLDTVVHGKVVNIVEVKKDASLMKQFGGALLGSAIGTGIGSAIGGKTTTYAVGLSGAYLGQDLVNNLYGEMVDRLEVETAEGISFKFLIHGHGFRVTDKVVITVKDSKVTSVVHEALYDDHAAKQRFYFTFKRGSYEEVDDCSGQQLPDTKLSCFSATTGVIPPFF